MLKPKQPVEMIGAHHCHASKGGFIQRRKPQHKASMATIKRAAQTWLNVKGPAIQTGFFGR